MGNEAEYLITDREGARGKLLTVATLKQGLYARVEFPGYTHSIPVSAQEAQLSLAELAQLLQQRVNPQFGMSRQEIQYTKLLEILAGRSSVDLRHYSGRSKQLQLEFARLERLANRTKSLFRGDPSHPYARGSHDKIIGMTGGIFVNGFNGPGSPYIYEDNYVWLTPDWSISQSYPNDGWESMPSDWLHDSGIYAIDPRALRGQDFEFSQGPYTPPPLKPSLVDYLKVPVIQPEYIQFCLWTTSQGQTQLLTNPGYRPWGLSKK